MDQLASVNCEFLEDSIDRVHSQSVEYYKTKELLKGIRVLRPKHSSAAQHDTRNERWAVADIYHGNRPFRPWALQGTFTVDNALYKATGKKIRTPGLYKRIDPDTCRTTKHFLTDTNERIHSSVRVRLACEGLSTNDSSLWRCLSLLNDWRPHLTTISVRDPITDQAAWGPSEAGTQGEGSEAAELGGTGRKGTNQAGPQNPAGAEGPFGGAHTATGLEPEAEAESEPDPDPTADAGGPPPHRWVWEYVGDADKPPYVTTMVEETMGPWERRLRGLSRGDPPVDDYAARVGDAEFEDMQRLAASITARAKARMHKGRGKGKGRDHSTAKKRADGKKRHGGRLARAIRRLLNRLS